MRKRVGYAKLGRSMPLALENCGSLGGDVEMVPTLKLLAERHPDVDFILIGRNSGELPEDVGLPSNVLNPWRVWKPIIRRELQRAGLNYSNLTIPDHREVTALIHKYTWEEFSLLDEMIMWLGQHGTTNTPLPSVSDRQKLTKPYDWATLYGSYLLQGINAWRDVDPLNREEVLLNADVRNYVKYRDSKWPWQHPVLAQYTYTNNVKHERYGADTDMFLEFSQRPVSDSVNWIENGAIWTSRVQNVYSRLEISSLIPGTPFGDTIKFNGDFNRPHDFGIVVNETRREVSEAKARRTVLRDWVLPIDNIGFIHGKWSQRSLDELGVDINPVPQLEYIPKLQTARCTFTTPASGSGWATAKPWEAFAAGVVCFFHPDYDDQNNILGDMRNREVADWLRCESPQQLADRIRYTCYNREVWEWLVDEQREHFNKAVEEKTYLKMIEERLDLP